MKNGNLQTAMVEEIQQETIHSHENTPKSQRHNIEIHVDEYNESELEDLKRAGMLT